MSQQSPSINMAERCLLHGGIMAVRNFPTAKGDVSSSLVAVLQGLPCFPATL